MRKYKRELPEVCCGERGFFFLSFFHSFFLFSFFFHVGLLHRSHSPRQFACLSESEKGGLSALTPHRDCASYPNRPLLAFKSRAPTSPPSCSTLLSGALLSPPPSFACQQASFAQRKRRPGLFFNEIKKREGAVYCHKANRGLSLQVRRITRLLPRLPPPPPR